MDVRNAVVAVALSLSPALFPGSAVSDPPTSQSEIAKSSLAEGQIVRIDEMGLRLTLKHGEIPSLDMGPMTMSFRVRSAAQLEGLHVGDQIRFRAERVDQDYVITHIEKP